jgi:nitroimidazol reductase NimA-like FMN-containing flavoprotein (pyridoxamine 5'-phosphate oxidase superfamily)
MLRKQCEVKDPEKIEAILAAATIGRMATTDVDGYPYITPVNFVYYQKNIYFHCAPKGEKLDNIARNAKVCFEVDIPLAYLDAGFTEDRSPCKLHQFYHCVVIRGRAGIVPDGPLKVDALNALVAKHEKGKKFKAVHADMADYRACRVVEIKPEKMTAKSELAQGKSGESRIAIAKHLKNRGGETDMETIRAFGLRPEKI